MSLVRRLDRYVFGEIVGPLGLGFLVYTFILLLQALFKSAEMIIRRGLPAETVGQILALSLPNIVVLTIPMALLFGILIAVGRLASDSELIAMRACGVSLFSLYRPILMVSLLLTLLNGFLMLRVLPWGNRSLQQLQMEIFTRDVSQLVEARVFNEQFEGKVLYVSEVPPGQQRWKGVFFAESLATSASEVTVAEWGEVRLDEDAQRVVLRLDHAAVHRVDLNQPERYEITSHEQLERVLQENVAASAQARVSSSRSLRSMTLPELRARLADPSPEVRNLAQVEVHKKLAIPCACLVFGLLALPLGFNNRRGDRSSGFALSIGVILIYYVLLNNGEEAARVGKWPPWLAMWIPNLLLSGLGAFLLMRRNSDKSLLLVRFDRWLRAELGGWVERLRLARQTRRTERRSRRRLRAADRAVRAAAGQTHLVLRLPRLRLAFPKLIDRYVLGLFALIFLLVLLSVLMVYVVADLSENLDDILRNDIPGRTVVEYYKYLSLQIFFDLAPVVVLVTTLITFSLLTRRNETIACRALGLSLYRLSLPAIVAAGLVAVFATFLQAEVLPASNERVARLKDRIKGRETARTYRRADRQWLFGQGRYIYNYLRYDPQDKSLQRLQVFEFDERFRLSRRLVANTARHLDGQWIFDDGWARSFDGIRSTSYERFTEPRLVAYAEKPEYFDSEVRRPEQMGYGELQGYVTELKAGGQQVPDLEVELHNKVAYPVISVVMALVALPFAFRLGRRGALYGIGVSIVLGMVFLSLFALFTTLGETGTLPPLVAVWSPNVVFALFSGYLYLGLRT